MIPKSPPAVLQTPGFAHYSLAWSPFHENRIALASSANFGLIGNGRLHFASIVPGPGPAPTLQLDKLYVARLFTLDAGPDLAMSFETQDGVFDVAWSEIHENQIVTASGDGSLRLWDVMLKVLSSSEA
jgi:peroxin-7